MYDKYKKISKKRVKKYWQIMELYDKIVMLKKYNSVIAQIFMSKEIIIR